ncbi:hypothetical protein B5M09_013378 [Aphanomyces astaci]|uniref:Tc3 transposase DNA binding domain-containing protein n=1 Tax=Aphanomyces astaci TaxID=112090 RepID=A0A425CZ64_APHAT|nr:hypothetical protein B5M09_013378 [Aphanomyces astaci]
MGRGPLLTEVEVGMVLALRDHGFTHRAITEHVGRSTKAIRTVIDQREAYGSNFKGQKPAKFIGRELQLLIREASKTGLSARSLATSLDIDASLRTCQRRLHGSENMEYVKRKHMPMLKKSHKIAREEYITVGRLSAAYMSLSVYPRPFLRYGPSNHDRIAQPHTIPWQAVYELVPENSCMVHE